MLTELSTCNAYSIRNRHIRSKAKPKETSIKKKSLTNLMANKHTYLLTFLRFYSNLRANKRLDHFTGTTWSVQRFSFTFHSKRLVLITRFLWTGKCNLCDLNKSKVKQFFYKYIQVFFLVLLWILIHATKLFLFVFHFVFGFLFLCIKINIFINLGRPLRLSFLPFNENTTPNWQRMMIIEKKVRLKRIKIYRGKESCWEFFSFCFGHVIYLSGSHTNKLKMLTKKKKKEEINWNRIDPHYLLFFLYTSSSSSYSMNWTEQNMHSVAIRAKCPLWDSTFPKLTNYIFF